MKILFIYCIIAFVYFVSNEIISTTYAKKRNAIYTFQRFKVEHFKIVIKSIFFPITIVMNIIDIVSELIFRKEFYNWRKK